MTRGCGGTLSSVVHAFGPSFPTIPPRASHYSRHEKRCPLVFQLSPFNHDRCQVQFKSFLECLLASPGTLVNELSNDRIFFEDSLPVNVQSHCPEILALYSSHSSSRSFFLSRFKGLELEIRTISSLAEQRSTIKLCSGSSWSNTGSSYRKILFRRFYEILGTIFSNDDG